MSFSFPYQYGFVDSRKIPYPIVTLTLETIRGRRIYSFIMDSGADTTTLPKYMLILLNIDRRKLKESLSQGIGETLVKTWEGTIAITFCGRSFPISCSFTDNDKTPLLLGKEGVFDKFTVTFDNQYQRTIFEEI